RPLAQGRKPPGHLRKAALDHETIHLADLSQPVEDPNLDNPMPHLKLWA
ncbi:37846_t:CDS:1, partial [Gigaspora margarita]